MLENDEMEPVI